MTSGKTHKKKGSNKFLFQSRVCLKRWNRCLPCWSFLTKSKNILASTNTRRVKLWGLTWLTLATRIWIYISFLLTRHHFYETYRYCVLGLGTCRANAVFKFGLFSSFVRRVDFWVPSRLCGRATGFSDPSGVLIQSPANKLSQFFCFWNSQGELERIIFLFQYIKVRVLVKGKGQTNDTFITKVASNFKAFTEVLIYVIEIRNIPDSSVGISNRFILRRVITYERK